MPYTLTLPEFSGPMETLLELIEARKLEVSRLALSRVTEDFLKHLERLRAEMGNRDAVPGTASRAHLALIADFLVVAARLILLKSKSLLPDLALTSDDEASIRDLETRLALYRDLKPVMRLVAKLWRQGARAFSRPYLMKTPGIAVSLLGAAETKLFYPGARLDQATLQSALAKLFHGLEQFTYETEEVQIKIRTLEEEMRSMVERLEAQGVSRFSKLSGSRSKSDVILAFLALLHLARDQAVSLTQSEQFSDILIKKHDTNIRTSTNDTN